MRKELREKAPPEGAWVGNLGVEKKTIGNADVCENKGVDKIATQKLLKTKE